MPTEVVQDLQDRGISPTLDVSNSERLGTRSIIIRRKRTASLLLSQEAGDEIKQPHLTAPMVERKPSSAERFYTQADEQWQGVVISVGKDEFEASLKNLRRDLPELVATFSLSEVSESDAHLVEKGGVFLWTIGQQMELHGQKSRMSTLRFRRLGTWRPQDLARAREAGSAYDCMLEE